MQGFLNSWSYSLTTELSYGIPFKLFFFFKFEWLTFTWRWRSGKSGSLLPGELCWQNHTSLITTGEILFSTRESLQNHVLFSLEEDLSRKQKQQHLCVTWVLPLLPSVWGDEVWGGNQHNKTFLSSVRAWAGNSCIVRVLFSSNNQKTQRKCQVC